VAVLSAIRWSSTSRRAVRTDLGGVGRLGHPGPTGESAPFHSPAAELLELARARMCCRFHSFAGYGQRPRRHAEGELGDPLRVATSWLTTGFAFHAADVLGEGLEERNKATADVLIGDQSVVIDHGVGDGHLCAGLFDDLGGGVAEDLAQ
jgi:hypothetical protein